MDRLTDEVDEEDWHLNREEVEGNTAAQEHYDILCTVAPGEAMAVTSSVEDFQFQGLRAWQKLHLKCNPRTMARAIRLIAGGGKPDSEVLWRSP